MATLLSLSPASHVGFVGVGPGDDSGLEAPLVCRHVRAALRRREGDVGELRPGADVQLAAGLAQPQLVHVGGRRVRRARGRLVELGRLQKKKKRENTQSQWERSEANIFFPSFTRDSHLS